MKMAKQSSLVVTILSQSLQLGAPLTKTQRKLSKMNYAFKSNKFCQLRMQTMEGAVLKTKLSVELVWEAFLVSRSQVVSKLIDC